MVPLRTRPSRSLRLAVGTAAAALLLVALALVFPGLFNREQGSPVLRSLGVRPDRDGRLLGHFPYRELASDQLASVAPGLQMQRDAAAALLAMQSAARDDGVDLVVLSGFRSIATQNKLFFDVKSERNQSAKERARVSAPPGYSEHSTGYAADLGDGREPQTNLSVSFEQTEAFAWLQQHAHRFQFVMSFPAGNPQGVSYEPWHWRFEGTAQALRVFEPALRLSR